MKRNLTFILSVAALVIAAFAFANAQSADSMDADGSTPTSDAVMTATDFTLTDTDGNVHTLSEYLADGKTVILEWFNPDCPLVKRYHAPGHENVSMTAAAEYAMENGIVWLAINSNAAGKQGSGLERNQLAAEEYELPYPVLMDETSEVGAAFNAKTTPQLFIITPEMAVEFNGPVDDSGYQGAEPTTNYVINALTELSEGEEVSTAILESFGCGVKYPD